MAAGSISTCVPEGRPLKKLTTPPRRTMASASCQAAGLPAASTTASGPRWSSVRARTAATTSGVSLTLIVAMAPRRRATSSGRVSAGQRNHANAAARKHAHKFQADRAAADHDGGVAGAQFHFVNAAQHAGQRLDQRRALVVHGVRHFQHVFGDDAAGNAHVFGVRAVVEQQVFAKIFLAAAAVIAAETRRGIGGDHANAHAPAGVHTLADGDDFADHFVAEDGGRLNHLGVIAALPDFQVGAIGQRQAHAQQHFVGGQRRARQSLRCADLRCRTARRRSSSAAQRGAPALRLLQSQLLSSFWR